MEDSTLLFIIIVIVVIGVAIWTAAAKAAEKRKRSKMTATELQKYQDTLDRQVIIKQFGNLNSALICPHCQTKGCVHTKPVKRKKGISGGKVAGAVLTGGFSILATGLSRKEGATQAFCMNCGSTWDF